MSRLLLAAEILIGLGLLLALLAALLGGPGTLTLFLTFGVAALLVGVGCYVAEVLRDLREKRVL